MRPLTNKTISGLYPPGSTIKTLVALSALENGIIKPLDTFRCKGKNRTLWRKISLLGKGWSWYCKLKKRNTKILRCIFL